MHTHTYTCLQCEPASGCYCLMGLCPPAGPPALPPAGWGPAPGSHYTSSSTGTDGSVGILLAARHAVPQFDVVPPASGGQYNTKEHVNIWTGYGVWADVDVLLVINTHVQLKCPSRNIVCTDVYAYVCTVHLLRTSRYVVQVSRDWYLVELWVAKWPN